MLGSTNLAQVSAQVSPAVQQAEAGAKQVVDYAFRKVLLLLALALAAALLYCLLSARIGSVSRPLVHCQSSVLSRDSSSSCPYPRPRRRPRPRNQSFARVFDYDYQEDDEDERKIARFPRPRPWHHWSNRACCTPRDEPALRSLLPFVAKSVIIRSLWIPQIRCLNEKAHSRRPGLRPRR